MIFEWNPELKDAIDKIKALPRRIRSIWLFHNREGQPYLKEDGTTSGFDNQWQRFMKKALTDTELKERFTEHDLRAKVASDTEAEHARLLLGHSSSAITERVYRRKPNIIKPLNRMLTNCDSQ